MAYRILRHFILLSTFTSLSLCQDLTGPRPQAQPPIVVQIQTPPANPWMRLAELVIPGIIGAGLALLGVWYTNKNNAVTNAANRQHDLEKLNREHSFGLKRDVLMRLTQLQVQTLAALRQWDSSRRYLEPLEINGEEEYGELKYAQDETATNFTEFKMRQNELRQATACSCLAVSDELWKSAQAISGSIVEAHKEIINKQSSYTKTAEQISEDITRFTEAARKELGIVYVDA